MAQRTGGALASWEFPKRSGIRIREVLNSSNGVFFNGSYAVTVPAKLTGKGRLRKNFKRREDAEAWAERMFRGQRLEGEGFFELTDAQRREMFVALPLLKERGIGLMEAVEFAIMRMRPRELTKTFREVVEELIASKARRLERGSLRAASYKEFRHRANRLAVDFGSRCMQELSAGDIKAWLNDLGRSTRTNRNYLAILREIFRYAEQNKYVTGSPLDELTDVERKELCGHDGEGKRIHILTPEEAERLLNAALGNPELDLLGAVVLALFCGVRTEELKKLKWDSVRLADSKPIVTVSDEIAKKRRMRHVDIPPVALEWLSLVPRRAGVVARNEYEHDYQRRFLKLRTLAGFEKWHANAMRHSFGSYHYALSGNPLETSRLLGHKASDQVLFDHYRALVTKERAEAYFALYPPKTESNLLRFCA